MTIDMKRLFTLCALLLVTTVLFAQNPQIGYVRTVQKPGKRVVQLSGVHIKTLENLNEAVSQEGGYFEIPVKVIGNQKAYTIISVSLADYELVDEGKLNKRQQYSFSPIEIVMISKAEDAKERKELEQRLMVEMEKNYKAKMDKLQGQYEEMEKLTQEYETQIDKLPDLVKELVRLDFKYITDSLDSQIAEAYSNGDFAQAIRLIDSKPSKQFLHVEFPFQAS